MCSTAGEVNLNYIENLKMHYICCISPLFQLEVELNFRLKKMKTSRRLRNYSALFHKFITAEI